MMEMSEPAPVEEVAPEAPQDAPEAQTVQDSPAPVEATPAPPEASPEPIATSNGAEAVVSVDVPPAPEPAPAPGWHDLVAQVGDMRLKLTALEDVQARLEQAMRQNESLQEQLALHQAAANTDAAALLKQVAALVAPFA